MFAFGNVRPIGNGDYFNASNYTAEGDGHFLAIEEAWEDYSDIVQEFANYNMACVEKFAKGYAKGGENRAYDEVNKFKQATMEGFFEDIKDKIVKLLKSMWEKIKSFFHSVMQYFNKLWLDEKEFAEKYEDEINKKELSGFKYDMFEYTFNKLDPKKSWNELQNAAINALKSEGVTYLESYMYDRRDWVGALATLMEITWVNDSKQLYSREPQNGSGWRQDTNNDSSDVDKSNFYSGKGYKYISKPNVDSVNDSTEDVTEHKEDKKDTKQSKVKGITSAQRKAVRLAVMKAMVSDFSGTSDDTFKRSIEKALQNGRTTSREIGIDRSVVINGLKNHNEDLSNLKEAQDAVAEGYKDEISRVNDIKNTGDEAVKARNRVAAFTEAQSVYLKFFEVYRNCLKKRGSQYKNCLSAMLHYKAEE